MDEVHKSHKLTQILQQLGTEAAMDKTLPQYQENTWIYIHKSMNEIWPYIQIIFEHNELIKKSKETIEQIRDQLGDNPT